MILELLPWITGAGGALVVLSLWVWDLRAKNTSLENDIKEIAKDCIECITTVTERDNQNAEWRNRVTKMLERLERRSA